MATRLERYSYNQFKQALDQSYNVALANLAVDGVQSVNWIKIDYILASYDRVWGNVSLYNGKQAQQAILGVSRLVDSAWKANVSNYINSVNYGRVKDVWGGTRKLYVEAVNDAIQTATNEGLGAEATQRRIRQLVNGKLKGDINVWRARRIARTEMVAAGNYGTNQAMVDSVNNYGARIQKVWITAMRESRDAHIAANGQVREVGQPFDVGGEKLQYPGDPTHGSAGNVINCQCVLNSQPMPGINFIRY